MALDHRTLMAVWRDDVTGCIDGKAVDMTLRLDKAGALPTCPQPQQPQMMIAQQGQTRGTARLPIKKPLLVVHTEGSSSRVHGYPGAHHSFLDSTNAAGTQYLGHWLQYNEAAAQDASARVRRFFKQWLAD